MNILKIGLALSTLLLVFFIFQLPIVGRVVAPNIKDPCGDGICDVYSGENIKTCSEDCGPLCGDGICSPAEYACVRGLGTERLCEKDCGECPPNLTSDSFIPMCIGDMKRYEQWCWLDRGVVVNASMKGAKDYDEATVVTWIKNTGGEDLEGLKYETICDHEYNGLDVHFEGDPSLLRRGDAIPLVVSFRNLDKVAKETYDCIVKVTSKEPRQVFERELVIHFV